MKKLNLLKIVGIFLLMVSGINVAWAGSNDVANITITIKCNNPSFINWTGKYCSKGSLTNPIQSDYTVADFGSTADANGYYTSTTTITGRYYNVAIKNAAATTLVATPKSASYYIVEVSGSKAWSGEQNSELNLLNEKVTQSSASYTFTVTVIPKVNWYAKVNAATVPSDGGKVNVSLHSSAGTFAETSYMTNSASSLRKTNVELYIHAQPTDESWIFGGWYNNADCTGDPVLTELDNKVTVEARSENSTYPTTYNYYAKFVQSTNTYYSQMIATGNENGDVFVGTVQSQGTFDTESSVLQSTVSGLVPTHTYYLYAQPVAGYDFVGWFPTEGGLGQCASTANPWQYNLEARSNAEDVPTMEHFYAVFRPTPEINTVNFTLENCTILPNILANDLEPIGVTSTTLESGSTVTIKSTEWVTVSNVYVNNVAISPNNGEYTFTVNSNTTVRIQGADKSTISLMAGISANSWMSQLPDNAFVANVSIPGAHNAATSGVRTSGAVGSAHCQDKEIMELLNGGVRCLDLRPAVTSNNSLTIAHGAVDSGVSMQDALDDVVGFLSAHSTEFCIIIMRHEADFDKSGIGGNGQGSKFNGLISTLLKSYADRGLLVDFRQDLTVGEMRGKILILCKEEDAYDGGPYGAYYGGGFLPGPMQYDNNMRGKDSAYAATFFIQNCYEVTGGSEDTQTTLAGKIEAVTSTMDKFAKYRSVYNKRCVWCINHTSGTTTSGLSASMTGNTNVAASTNAGFLAHLAKNRYNDNDSYGVPLGIVLTDFACVNTANNGAAVLGSNVVNAIINNNFSPAMRLMLSRENEICFIQNVGTQMFMQPGRNHGTRLDLDIHPYPIKMLVNRIDDKMWLQFPGMSNSNINYGCWIGWADDAKVPYSDKDFSAAEWSVRYNQDGTFQLDMNFDGHLMQDFGWDGTEISANISGDFSKWRIVTQQDLYDSMAAASADNRVDCTGLLSGAKYIRNSWAHDNDWTRENVSNYIGITEYNNLACRETWNANMKYYTEVWLPAGVYELKVDGFYRNGSGPADEGFTAKTRRENGTEELLAYLFADINADDNIEYRGNLMSSFDEFTLANNERMIDKPENASVAFFNGRFNDSGVYFLVPASTTIDGKASGSRLGAKVRLGLRKDQTEDRDWMVFNNFRLFCYGQSCTLAEAFEATEIAKFKETINICRSDNQQYKNARLTNALNIYSAYSDSELQNFSPAQIKAMTKDLAYYRMSAYSYYEAGNDINGAAGLATHQHEGNLIEPGDYYLYNHGRKRWLQGDDHWGTRACLGNPGIMVTIESNGDGTYRIDTHLANGVNQHYLNAGPYVDCDAFSWNIVRATDTTPYVYNIQTTDATPRILGCRPDDFESLGTEHWQVLFCDASFDPAHPDNQWKLIKKEDRDQPITDLYNAGMNNNHPGDVVVDATHLIADSRFDHRYNHESAWTMDGIEVAGENVADGNDLMLQGNDSPYMCASQTITGLTPGKYWIACQGLYRPINFKSYYGMYKQEASTRNSARQRAQQRTPNYVSAVSNKAVLFAQGSMDSEEQTTPIPDITEGVGQAPGFGDRTSYDDYPNTYSQAADYFYNGLYKTKYITSEVGEDGNLTIGVRATDGQADNWLVADNFTMYYAGAPETTGVEDIEIEEEATSGDVEPEYYNLQGVRVTNPSHGIYIRVRGNVVDKVTL